MRLSLRFVFLVAALLLSVGASAISGWHALNRLDAALDAVVRTDMERLLAITHARRLFRSMVVLERDFMLSSAQDERNGMDKKMAKAGSDLLEQIEKYARLMPPDDAAAIESIRGARTRWIDRDRDVREAARAGRPDTTSLAALHATDPVSWEAVIGSLVQANEKRLAAQVERTHRTSAAARQTLVIVSMLAAVLASTFGYLIFAGIRKTVRAVEDLNTNLEGLVKTRTEALAARERSLRLVLDSTGEGIIGVTSSGTLAEGTSAAAVRSFGEPKQGEFVARYLFPDQPDREMSFQVALEQLLEGFLPWEVVVGQMPSHLERGEQVLELEYRPVTGGAGDAALLILARDVTARVRSEKAELEAREQQSLVAKLLTDKDGFSAFVRDAERLLSSLESEGDLGTVRRDLHTLKGNVAIYGLGSMARRCHDIETRLEEAGGRPSPSELADLSELFHSRLKGIEDFLTGLGRKVYEVETSEHRALIDKLLGRYDSQELLKMVELWTWPRASERLARLRGQVEYVARRLHKSVRVEVEHNDVRLPADYLTRFWATLTHVTRNAVDHGIESEAVRTARGKPGAGLIRLRTWETDDSFCLEVADDGGGIDIDAVRRLARARGVDEATIERNPLDLVLLDGISARADVTDLSGRGVGLPAVREACAAEGGRIEISTEQGKGTNFVFRFRRPVVQVGRLAAEVERHWSFLPERSAAASAGSATVIKVTRSGTGS